jgi:hypothetical protein
MIATTVERLRDLGGVLGSRIPGAGVEVLHSGFETINLLE